MNFIKKFAAAALAVVVTASASVSLSARSYDDVDAAHDFEEQIDVLSDIGVIKGTSATEFSPDNDVTREQMAMLLFRLMLNKADGGTVNTSPFTDLYDDTYSGAISWASSSGYILGTAENTFSPRAGITLQDAMTMVVRALGQSSDKMNAGYPWTYIDAAIKLGLDKNLGSVAYTETLTRAETAALLHNALTAKYLVPRTLSNGVTIYEETTVIEEIFGYEMDDATLTATNSFALEGSATVKNGYVTLKTADGKTLTVKKSELGVDDADNALNRTFRIIYTVNENKTISILSAIETGKTETYTSASVDSDKKTIEINGVKYTVVEKHSDALSTNDNELTVYAYENSGRLTQLKSVKELADRLGLYEITLIFEDGAETATRALIKNYRLGMLSVDTNGKINLADNKTSEELTGGFVNTAEAENGDYVLFAYNSAVKKLEIASLAEITAGTVTRLTSSTVKIGDTTYKLGNELAGITAASISASIRIGGDVTAVVHNGAVIGILNAVVESASSQYLVAVSSAMPVFADGAFRYVMNANINGSAQNIIVSNSSVTVGEVYRYTVAGSVYTLIPAAYDENRIISGANQFVQNGNGVNEIAAVVDSAASTSIANTNGAFYILDNGNAAVKTSASTWNDIYFVTDSDTVMLVGGQFKKGVFNSTVTVADGAKVVAVFDNEPGSVETLRFLYVSNGSLGSYDSASETVEILKFNGYTYENKVVLAEYTVFNYATGKTELRYSEVGTLQTGAAYRTASDGKISTVEDTNIIFGFISGYTNSTVTTTEGETFRLASDVKITSHDSDFVATEKTVADTYMNHISFTVINGEVKAIRLLGSAGFKAEVSGNTVVLTPDFDLSAFDASTLAAVKLTASDNSVVSGSLKAEIGENNTIVITDSSVDSFAAGKYTVAFTLAGRTMSVSFTAPEAAAE